MSIRTNTKVLRFHKFNFSLVSLNITQKFLDIDYSSATSMYVSRVDSKNRKDKKSINFLEPSSFGRRSYHKTVSHDVKLTVLIFLVYWVMRESINISGRDRMTPLLNFSGKVVHTTFCTH